MADISKINPNGTEYNLKDATARAGIESSKTLKSSVVTVTDAAPINAEDITVDITPIQDLHGYDKPWAGGAGKNKLPMTVEGIKAANTSGTWSGNVYTVNGVEFDIQVDGGGNILGIYVSGNASNVARLFLMPFMQDYSYLSGMLASMEGAGSVCEFFIQRNSTPWTYYAHVNDASSVIIGEGIPDINTAIYLQIPTNTSVNVTVKPMIRLASEQDSTFAPYSNICPIEGRTGAELDRVGRNWMKEPLSLGDIRSGDGQEQSSNVYLASEYFHLNPAFTYYFRTPTTIRKWVYFYDKNKQYLGRDTVLRGNTNQNFTSPSNAFYVRILINVSEYGYSAYQNDICINISDANFNGRYEPYQGQQYTASFGETVYGGEWHVTEGGTDKTHANIASYNGETINEPWLSSMDEYVAGATPTTGAQVVYPLTTPTTISTPKQNVPMLKGINTVSADCGDTQLKYQPDNVIGELKGEIQKANSFVSKMALREGSGAKDFSYGGWSFRLYIYRSMGQISMSVERISASSVTEQAVVKVFNDESDYRAPEELRPNFNLLQAATYTTPSGWAIQVYLKDDGYIMFTGIAPEVGASAPTSSNWNLVEPWATHQQAKDLFNN